MPLPEFIKKYRRVYHLRRGTVPAGDSLFENVLTRWHSLLTGDVLLWDDKPIAMSLLFRVATKETLFVNAVNSPIDPAFIKKAAGNVLAFQHKTQHEAEAHEKQIPLRYCRDRMNADYKKSWCVATNAYITR